MVEDNLFNRSKAEVIIETLQSSLIRNFVFQNKATGFDADQKGGNYSKFDIYMKPIKSLLMKSDVTWGSKLVI